MVNTRGTMQFVKWRVHNLIKENIITIAQIPSTNLLITNSTLPDNKLHQFVAALKFKVPMMGHGCDTLGKHVLNLHDIGYSITKQNNYMICVLHCFFEWNDKLASQFINWPASSVWVFIAQLGEHCSANAEATGSNPVEAPKIFFSGYFRNCLNCDSLRWSHTHFTVSLCL